MPQRPIVQRVSERQRLRLQAGRATELAEQTALKHNHLIEMSERLDHRLRLVEFERDLLESTMAEFALLPWWKRRWKVLGGALQRIENDAFERLQQYVAAGFMARFFQRFWSGIEAKRAEEARTPTEATGS